MGLGRICQVAILCSARRLVLGIFLARIPYRRSSPKKATVFARSADPRRGHNTADRYYRTLMYTTPTKVLYVYIRKRIGPGRRQ
jgi:hypothetical protein